MNAFEEAFGSLFDSEATVAPEDREDWELALDRYAAVMEELMETEVVWGESPLHSHWLAALQSQQMFQELLFSTGIITSERFCASVHSIVNLLWDVHGHAMANPMVCECDDCGEEDGPALA